MDIHALNHFMNEQLSGSDTPLAVHKEDQEEFAQLFEQEIANQEDTSKARLSSQLTKEEEETEFNLPVLFLTEYMNEVVKEHSVEETVSEVTLLQESKEFESEKSLTIEEQETLLEKEGGIRVNTNELAVDLQLNTANTGILEEVKEEPLTFLTSIAEQVRQEEIKGEESLQNAVQTVLEQEVVKEQLLTDMLSAENSEWLNQFNNGSLGQNEVLDEEELQVVIRELTQHIASELETEANHSSYLETEEAKVSGSESYVIGQSTTEQTLKQDREHATSHLRSLKYIESDIDWTTISIEEKEQLIEVLETDILNTRPTINQKEFKQIGQSLDEVNRSSFSKNFAAEPEIQEQVSSKDSQESELAQATTLDLRVGTPLNTNQTNEVPLLNQSEAIHRIQEMITERIQEPNQSEIHFTRIQLTPETLGEIEIQLEWRNNEFVGRMLVTSKETKEWMESQLREFSRGLNQLQHINVRRIEIQVVTPTENTEKSAFQFSSQSQSEGQSQRNTQENNEQSLFTGNKKSYQVTETTESNTKRADANESGRLSLLV